MGHRRRRNGVVGAIHRRGDVREVREGGGRGAARGVGWWIRLYCDDEAEAIQLSILGPMHHILP